MMHEGPAPEVLGRPTLQSVFLFALRPGHCRGYLMPAAVQAAANSAVQIWATVSGP